ncbi:gamma carbonic anhydrase family protein [Planctomonas psychrotolerans]|uniref:gamma carbonic anhydrase family protein n=1 Tax=Planctomonas psychrotolerans TaxID=2528712 RepID=UPI00123C6428|nr:gamma carbonic anhydrase family protein [Planctomonas psychrotolerans]
MTVDPRALVLSVQGSRPVVHDTAFASAGATLIGRVRIDAEAGVWFNAVLRAETESIHLGAGSNVQDNVSCHVDAGFPLTIGRNVSIGHNAVVHGCTIEDDVLVGMGAIVLNGAVLGAGSLIAAGTVVLEGTVVPPRSLVAGVPGRIRRDVTEAEVRTIRRNAERYRELAGAYGAGGSQ